MLGILLGLAASLSGGVSDFIGGLESRRSPQIGVMLVSSSIGLVPIVLVALLTGADVPAAKYLLLGAAAGASLTLALFALYRGLSTGTMSVVAPIAATGAIVPVVVDIVGGQRPDAVRLAGAAIAILGVALVSLQEGSQPHRAANGTSLVLALVAALGFGWELVALKEAAQGDPLWASVAAGATYTVLLLALAAISWRRRVPVRPRPGRWPAMLLLGVCFGGANVFYAIASRHGALSNVAIATSLYPIVTVLLARWLLSERVRRIQELGILAAIAGVAMLAAG